MDIHKPKPVHSLMEFLGEIGTITVGVLIALSLEAAVEAWRAHDLVSRARAELTAELRHDRDVLTHTVASAKATAAPLNMAIAWGEARLARGVVKAPSLNLDMSFAVLHTSAWQSTVATQALTHMPFAQTLALSNAYDHSRGFNDFESQVEQHWFQVVPTIEEFLSASGPGVTGPELREGIEQIRIASVYQGALERDGERLLHDYDTALKVLGEKPGS